MQQVLVEIVAPVLSGFYIDPTAKRSWRERGSASRCTRRRSTSIRGHQGRVPARLRVDSRHAQAARSPHPDPPRGPSVLGGMWKVLRHRFAATRRSSWTARSGLWAGKVTRTQSWSARWRDTVKARDTLRRDETTGRPFGRPVFA